MGGCSGAPAAARSAKASTAGSGTRPAPEDGTGTQPPSCPYDLRHAALSLWLASGAPPAEIAARAGHSVRVLLTIYAHCIPGCDQIASQHIEQALRPSNGPHLARKNPRRRQESRPSCVRATARLNGTQLDLKPPPRSGYTPVTCAIIGQGAAPDGRSWAPVPP